jgi:hypothetical protein
MKIFFSFFLRGVIGYMGSDDTNLKVNAQRRLRDGDF